MNSILYTKGKVMEESISDLTSRIKKEDISFIKTNEEKLIREINDLQNRKLILFLGAGVSKSYGLKSWNEVAEKLIAKLYKSSQEKFSDHEISLISSYNEAEVKKKILLAEKFLNIENSNGNDYYEVLESCVCYSEEGKILNRYKEKNKGSATILDEIREILKLENSMCLTTNIDRLIETKLELEKKEISIGSKGYGNKNKKLYKIHGCIDYRDTIVFTPKEYFEFYNNRKQINKLKEKMKSSVVIFIGKEIEDEIIQAFFYEGENTEKEEKKSVYLIKSYNSVKDFDLKSTLKIEKEYYSHYGIRLLPYDEYSHLPNYVKRIKEEINLIKKKKIEHELTSFNIDRLDPEKNIKEMQEISNGIQSNKFMNLEETNKENYEDIKKFINENYVELLGNEKIYNRHNFIIELKDENIEKIWSSFDFKGLTEFSLINLIQRSSTINKTKLEKLLISLAERNKYIILTNLIELKRLDKEAKNKLIKYIFEIEDNELKNIKDDSYELEDIIDKLYLSIEDDENKEILEILSGKLGEIDNVSLHYSASNDQKWTPNLVPETASILIKLMNKIIFKDSELIVYSIEKIEELNKEDILENYLGYLVNNDTNNIKILGKDNLKKILSSFWISAIYNKIKKSENKDQIIKEIKKIDILKEIKSNYHGFVIADLIEDKTLKKKYKNEFKKEKNVFPSLPSNLTLDEEEQLKYSDTLDSILNDKLDINTLIEKINEISESFFSKGIEKIYFKHKEEVLNNIREINPRFIMNLSENLNVDESFELLKKISQESFENYESIRYYGLVSNILKEYKQGKQKEKLENMLENTYNLLQFVMKNENDKEKISESGIGIDLLYQFTDIIFQTLFYENKSVEERAELFWCKINKWKEEFPKIINLFLGENLGILEWFYLNSIDNLIKENWGCIINNKKREFYIGFCHLNRVSKELLKSLTEHKFFIEWIDEKYKFESYVYTQMINWIILLFNDETFNNEQFKNIMKDEKVRGIILGKYPNSFKNIEKQEKIWEVLKRYPTIYKEIRYRKIIKLCKSDFFKVKDLENYFQRIVKKENYINFSIHVNRSNLMDILSENYGDKNIIKLFSIIYFMKEKLDPVIKKLLFEVIERKDIKAIEYETSNKDIKDYLNYYLKDNKLDIERVRTELNRS